MSIFPPSRPEPSELFNDLLETPPDFDPNEPVPEDFGAGATYLPGYEDILKNETREVDDHQVGLGETAIYLPHIALWRLCNNSVRGDNQPLVLLRLHEDGLFSVTAGDTAIRSDAREVPIEVRTVTGSPDPLELLIDHDEMVAALRGAEGTIRIVHKQGAPALAITSGSFQRPLELHDSRLPRLLRGKLSSEGLQKTPVSAASLLKAFEYLHPFAASNLTDLHRSIEFKAGAAIAGGHDGAGQVQSHEFLNLNFQIDRDLIGTIVKMLNTDKDGVIQVSTTNKYLFLESERSSLAVPQSERGADPRIDKILAIQLSNNYDSAMISREILRRSLLPAVETECRTVRLRYHQDNAFIFITTKEDGQDSQFKIVGRQRRFPFERPNADFRMNLPLFYGSLASFSPPNVHILSSDTAVIVDDEHDELKTRTILPLLPVSPNRPRDHWYRAPSFTLTPEEIVDDNL